MVGNHAPCSELRGRTWSRTVAGSAARSVLVEGEALCHREVHDFRSQVLKLALPQV